MRRQAQCVLIETNRRIGAAIRRTDQYRSMESRARDLNQQSDDRKNNTKSRAFTPSPSER